MTGLRARQKAKREARILDAALSNFRANGFEAARMEQIAESAELSTGTLYNYFPTKGDLLVAIVVLETADTLTAGVDIVENPPEDATEALMALAKVWYRHSFRLLDKALWRHAFAMMIERPEAPASLRFARNDAKLRSQIADLITVLQKRGVVPDAVDPQDAGLCLFHLIDRSFMACVTDDSMSIECLLDMLSRQISLTSFGLRGS